MSTCLESTTRTKDGHGGGVKRWPESGREVVAARMEGVGRCVLTMKIRQPSYEFTFGVGISFIPYPLVLTPLV
jgi:hypothetical protein